MVRGNAQLHLLLRDVEVIPCYLTLHPPIVFEKNNIYCMCSNPWKSWAWWIYKGILNVVNMNVVHLYSGLTIITLRCLPQPFSRTVVFKQKDVSYILKKFFFGEKVWKRVLVKNFGFISLFFKDFLQKIAWIFILRNLSYVR